MTKRQKLIAYWLASVGSDAVLNARRVGSPPSRSDWDGFAENDSDPEPSTAEINEVLTRLSRSYYASV